MKPVQGLERTSRNHLTTSNSRFLDAVGTVLLFNWMLLCAAGSHCTQQSTNNLETVRPKCQAILP